MRHILFAALIAAGVGLAGTAAVSAAPIGAAAIGEAAAATGVMDQVQHRRWGSGGGGHWRWGSRGGHYRYGSRVVRPRLCHRPYSSRMFRCW